MKSLLVFPAQWYPTQPYLSTPYLCAYLREKGWDVTQRDFNIESYDHFLSPTLLQNILSKIEGRLNALKEKKSFSFKEKSLMDVLATSVKFAPTIISGVNDAKQVMRTPESFFDFSTNKQADMVIKSALKLVSDAYSPSILTLSTFESGTRAEESTQRATEFARNNNINPFIDLYEKVLLPSESWEGYNLVGISIVGISQILPGLTLARLLKEKYPHLHISLGGPIFSVNSKQLMGHPEFFQEFCDSIVTFEGEEPLHRLLTTLKNGSTLKNVPNLLFYENGKIESNEERVELRFEEMPPPTFDGLPMDLYLSPYPILPVLQSRGCYWGKCTFCTHSFIYGHRYGKQRTEQMVDELALAGGWDPLDWRIKMTDGDEPWQRVLLEMKEKSGWTTDLPDGEGMGCAVVESHGSIGGVVANVSVSRRGQIFVDRIQHWTNCGYVLNRQNAAEQVQSAIAYELGASMFGGLDLRDGRIKNVNFDTYTQLRMPDMPPIEVNFALSQDGWWGGMGEPGGPPVSPAVANAIFFATGTRVRETPFIKAEL